MAEPTASRYFMERIYARCQQCRCNEARRRLVVDPGSGHPVTVLGVFCGWCAKTQLNEYVRGRKAFVVPGSQPEANDG